MDELTLRDETLDSKDGSTGVFRRSYPRHLEEFHRYDREFLAALADLEHHRGVTAKQLARIIYESNGTIEMAQCSRLWAASADWRQLVVATEDPMDSRRYAISPKGNSLLSG